MKHADQSLRMTFAVSAAVSLVASCATLAASSFIGQLTLPGGDTPPTQNFNQGTGTMSSSRSSTPSWNQQSFSSSSRGKSSSSQHQCPYQDPNAPTPPSCWNDCSKIDDNGCTRCEVRCDPKSSSSSERSSSSASSSSQSSWSFTMPSSIPMNTTGATSSFPMFAPSSIPTMEFSSMPTMQFSSMPTMGTIGGGIGTYPFGAASSDRPEITTFDRNGMPYDPKLPVFNAPDTQPTIRPEVPVVNADVGVKVETTEQTSSAPDSGATNNPFLGCYSPEGVWITDREFCDPDQSRHIFAKQEDIPQIDEEQFRRTMTEQFHDESISPQVANLLQVIDEAQGRLEGYKNDQAEGYDDNTLNSTLSWLWQLEDRFRNSASLTEEVAAAAEQVKFELTNIDRKAAQNRLTSKVVLIVTHMRSAIDICADNGINLPFETVNAYRMAEETLKQQCPYSLENCGALPPFVDAVDNLRVTMEMAIGANGRDDVAEQIENLFR